MSCYFWQITLIIIQWVQSSPPISLGGEFLPLGGELLPGVNFKIKLYRMDHRLCASSVWLCYNTI